MKKILLVLASSLLLCAQLFAVSDKTFADDKLKSVETFKDTYKRQLKKYYERKIDTKIDLTTAAKQKALMEIQQSINNEKQTLILQCKELQQMAKDLNEKALGDPRPGINNGANIFNNECNKMIDIYSDLLIERGNLERYKQPLKEIVDRINQAKTNLETEKPFTEKRKVALELVKKALDILKNDIQIESSVL